MFFSRARNFPSKNSLWMKAFQLRLLFFHRWSARLARDSVLLNSDFNRFYSVRASTIFLSKTSKYMPRKDQDLLKSIFV